MIYTDKIHLVADTLEELHEFAENIGIKRCWFHGTRKGHPHYDIQGYRMDRVSMTAEIVSSKEILRISKQSLKK